MRLDTTYSVNTPEGIELRLSPAGPVPRLLAWVIDLAIRGGISLVLIITFALLGNTGTGVALIITFLLEWFYPVWFELRHNGQTPGKRVLQIYVANADASPVTFSASIIRNLLRVVDFLPLMYGFGLISVLLNRRFQRLGDLAANTVVLHQDEKRTHTEMPDVDPVRPGIKLTLPEQQAIILFAERTRTLTEERAAELAQMTGQLVPEQHQSQPQNQPQNQQQASAHLRGIASWLSGRKA